jgi:hypothetical protein
MKGVGRIKQNTNRKPRNSFFILLLLKAQNLNISAPSFRLMMKPATADRVPQV